MSPRILVALFSLGTLGAAVGGYTALRHNATDAQATTLSAPTEQAVTPAARIDDVAPSAEISRSTDARPAPVAPKPSKPASVARAAEKSPEPGPQPSATPSAPAPVSPVGADAAKTEAPDVHYEPASAPPDEPAKPLTEELTIARDSVIGIRLENTVSSQTARVEDKVTARVARDVSVDGRTALSNGSRLEGVVSSVERGGKFKDRARIGITFTTLVLPDNTRLPIETETIFRESDSPTTQAATKVGASAAIGGILGAVIGGKKGAAIGSTVGAAGGAATVAAGSAPDAALTAGTPLTVRLSAPLTLNIQLPREE